MARRARRGSGHIYRRGRVYWFKFFDVQGKPHWRSSGSRDRSVAEAMLRDQLGQRDAASIPASEYDQLRAQSLAGARAGGVSA